MENTEIFFRIVGTLYIVATGVICVFSLITLCTIIYYWNPRCRSISNLLICNSNVAFLLLNVSIIIQIPNVFNGTSTYEVQVSTTLCRFQGFLFLFGCVAKILSYLIQAISRYFIIVLHQRRKLLTFRTNLILIILCWTISLMISGFTWFSPVAFQYEPESRLCLLTTKVFYTCATLMLIGFLIPVNSIIILYAMILSHTTRTNLIQPNSSAKKNNRRNMKVFKNILTLVVILVLGGTPYSLSLVFNLFIDVPWPWYSISILFMMYATSIDSCYIFLMNKEVRNIIYRKLFPSSYPDNRRRVGGQTIVPLTMANGLEQIRTTQAPTTRY